MGKSKLKIKGGKLLKSAMRESARRVDAALRKSLTDTLQRKRSCRVCGCTEERACSIPCSWSPLPGDDICIHCFVMRLELQKFFIRVHDRSIWDLHCEDLIRRILAEPGMMTFIRAGKYAPIPPRPDPAEKVGPLDADWADSLEGNPV